MLERTGDIFAQKDADAICFTSNGMVTNKGELVMGAGVALEFKKRYPLIPRAFGRMVNDKGNHVHLTHTSLHAPCLKIISFPTKNDWKDPSDLALIKQSAEELLWVATNNNLVKIYLTRPGCGLGGLDWETQVKPLISPILDDRFIILTPPVKS